jgi:hypothetical protein
MTKSNHGGARKGAGRKPSIGASVPLNVRLGVNDVEWLDNKANQLNNNRSGIVRWCIKRCKCYDENLNGNLK